LAAGVISNVPGGIGVFEAILLLLLPSMPKGSLLAPWSPIAPFTISLPFAVALALLGRTHSGCIARPLCAWCGSGETFLIAVTPQAIAIACSWRAPCCCSRRYTRTWATPGPAAGFRAAPILELSHLSQRRGVGLLVIAHGLYRRLDAGMGLTSGLLCAGILVSLLKGIRL